MNFIQKAISYLKSNSRVLLEVAAANEKKRYVVSIEEWTNIKNWYYDDSIREDYLLTLDESDESYMMVRLTKGNTEIRVWEINRLGILSKNLWNLLITPVPRIMRFFSAFFIAALIWPIVVPISFFVHQELTESALKLATNLTSVIFLVFLLANIIFFIFKIVDALLNRYRAFYIRQETFIMDTLIFNLVLLGIFSAIGGNGIIKAALSIWDYVNKFI